jgi:hypothetical protein
METIGPVIEAMAAALDGRQGGSMAPIVDERTLLHVSGSSGLAGDYQGREAICGLFERMATACDGTLHFETVCTSTDGDHGVRVHGRIRAARLGRSLDAGARLEAALAGHVIREASVCCIDQAAWDAFWA